MPKLIGNAPNQVPTNADLGSMAFEDKVSVANINATGTKDATTFLRGDNTFASAGGGKVLQVVSTTVTTASATSTSTSHVDIPGMTLTITPSSTSNKILIMWKCMYSNASGDAHFGFLNRNGTDIALGTSAGQDDLSTFPMLTANGNNYWGFDASGTFLDSPSSTSALTYKLQVCSQSDYTIYFNRSTRGTYDGCYISTITAMEIAA